MGFTITEKILARVRRPAFGQGRRRDHGQARFRPRLRLPGLHRRHLQADEERFRHRRRWPSPSASASSSTTWSRRPRRPKKSCTRARASGRAINDVTLYERQGHRPPGLVRSGLRHAGRLRGPFRRPCQPARHLRHAGDRPPAQRARSVRDARSVSIKRAADRRGSTCVGTLQPGRDGARRVPPHRARAGPGVVPLPGARDRRARRSPTCPTRALQTITGLAMFTGAVTAIVNPDAKRLAYALPRARKKLEPVSSDDGRDLRGRPRRSTCRRSSRSSSFRRARPTRATSRTTSASRCRPAIWAPAHRAGSRTCAPPPRCCAGARSRRRSRSTSSRPARRSWPPPPRKG